jgi:hypothetical protein
MAENETPTQEDQRWLTALVQAVPGLQWSKCDGTIQGWHEHHGRLATVTDNGRDREVVLLLQWDYHGHPEGLAGNLREKILRLWEITNDLLGRDDVPLVRWEALGQGSQLMVGEHRVGRVTQSTQGGWQALFDGKIIVAESMVQAKRLMEQLLEIPEIYDHEP